MHTWHMLRRGLTAALLAGALLALAAPRYAAAQGEDPAALVEARALAAHLQNLRLNSYTAWIGGSLGAPDRAPRRSPLAEQLDGWTLTGFAGDEDHALADLERPVLLNFWASWCTPCRAEFPHLVAIATAPDAYAFDVIFVNTSDTERDARAFLADYPTALTTTIDTGERLSLRAGIESIPTSLLLDADGTVLAVHTGTITPTVSTFLDAVAQHPGAGVFIAANHMTETPGATLAPVSVEDTEPLIPGDTVQSTLDDTQFQHAYRITANAGDQLSATMTAGAGDLDPYLVLLTADGERLAENDDIDRGVNIDARIDATLPATGTYLIVATRFLEAEGFSSGMYELTVRLTPASGQPPTGFQAQAGDATPAGVSTPHPDRPGEAGTGGGTIRYGQTVRGAISDRQHAQHWTFEGQAGDTIDIVMQRTVNENGGLDGYLILEGPGGDPLLEVDDTADSVMPAIHDYELPANGTYTIVATRFSFDSGFSTGDYTLTLNLAGAELPTTGNAGPRWPLPETVRWIGYNDIVHGQIDAANVDDWYAFRGRAGDTIAIRMAPQDAAPGALDPFLILTDITGAEVARNDDGNPAANPTTTAAALSIELPHTATYLIRATRYGFENGPSSGAYELALTSDAGAEGAAPGAETALSYGDFVSGRLTAKQPVARYRFDGQAGDTITLRVTGAGSLAPAFILRGPSGDVLADEQRITEDHTSALLRFPLPATGRYTLDILPQDLNGIGDYRLLLLGYPQPRIDPGAFVPAPGLDLELVLIWASTADLDLAFSAAETDRAALRTTRANDFCQDVTATPVERVTWNAGHAMPGRYSATIHYRHNCTGQPEPVHFILAIAQHGEVIDIIGGTLAREGDTYTTPIAFGQ